VIYLEPITENLHDIFIAIQKIYSAFLIVVNWNYL